MVLVIGYVDGLMVVFMGDFVEELVDFDIDVDFDLVVWLVMFDWVFVIGGFDVSYVLGYGKVVDV